LPSSTRVGGGTTTEGVVGGALPSSTRVGGGTTTEGVVGGSTFSDILLNKFKSKLKK
jgi:hypothetical protein